METVPPRTLLVLKPSSFGDIVHTLPAVSRLKAAWPQCRISWLVNTEWVPLLEGNPDVDEIIPFPRRKFRGWQGALPTLRWARAEIAGRRPELALDFQGLLRSALLGRVSGAGALEGLSDAREGAGWLYHRTVDSPKQPAHAVERYLALADAVLAARGRLPDPDRATLRFPLYTGTPPPAPLSAAEEFILLHPYARGKDKSLSESDLESLLRKIRSKKIVLVGTASRPSSRANAECIDLSNQTTLPQLIWLVRHASFVLSVDSGPAHLAAALGRPMISIHAWSDPRKVGPYHPDAWVWKNGQITQMRHLGSMDPAFFAPNPLRLRETDLDAIARLVTSPSDFCA